MNAHFWLCMLLGPLVGVIAPRLFVYLARLSDPFPEEIHLLTRPLDWEQVKVAFDANDARNEVSHPASRRLLRYRFAISQEYLMRMEHNVRLAEVCAETDQRETRKINRSMAQETSIRRPDPRDMLEAAEMLESDALLTEDESQAGELREHATDLRLNARDIFAQTETAHEDSVRESQMVEALQAARQFRRAVRIQLMKVDLLMVLLRLDKLRLLPSGPVIALWDRGNRELLFLYRLARSKATVYLAVYHQNQDLVTDSWGVTD